MSSVKTSIGTHRIGPGSAFNEVLQINFVSERER